MCNHCVLKRGRFTRFTLAVLAAHLAVACCKADADSIAVVPGAGGRLVYERDELGNRIPDFSHCGYEGADREIPDVPVRVIVKPADGNDGERIQAAIDRVAKLPADEQGFRGAVLLAAGRFEVAGQIRISASGIVLRGSGAGKNGTLLVATGLDRRSLIRVDGVADRRPLGPSKFQIVDEYAPVGTNTLRLDSVNGLKVGERVFVVRPCTQNWIAALGADAFGVGWKPGTRDIRWDRVVTSIDDQTITLDAPITTAIEKRFGGGTVEPYDWPGRTANAGIEDLRLQSEYSDEKPLDEEHAWWGIVMENVENAWVRRVEFRHFSGGAVALWESTNRVTVEDCISLEPVSELGGYRRHTFFTQGQLALFLRCWSEHGRHDFSTGHCAAGPNAFVNCHAADAKADSGPIESWASGVLYDNVRIDGAGLHLDNRWITPPGAGWSAANCVLWQCQAATMRVFRPPTTNNWAIGNWAGFSGDGTFQASSDFVKPISLYHGQLRERRGSQAAAHVELGLVDPIGSTNPTPAEAAAFTAQSAQAPRRLIEVIRERFNIRSIGANGGATPPDSTAGTVGLAMTGDSDNQSTSKRLNVKNGWLVVGDKLKTGGLQGQGFWRGTVRPDEAVQFGPAITRFVPGRAGLGFTDDLSEVADTMFTNHVAVFDHHYGLWYDRRRDDHTMVRQENGNVAPPFYEQPFARTGRGKAWDGLSKYDLTRFNPWYWNRLRDFAELCDERGLVLFHQNYFQHNILEAGAHWADCPWRPANNVNDPGFPEPPPYIGDKRIFMAEKFYDVTHARRRELHRGYIRRCLDNFAGSSNVIQMTSAEHSGPLEFTQFWLDTIIDWQREHGRDVLVALSAPKDVQESILADAKRGPHVDVIDIRYWAYTADDGLYAPEGGKNLAPRQHLRQTKEKPGGFAAIVKAVREYRTRYPAKAVTYYADMHCPSGRDGWAVLMGGGSLPKVKLPAELDAVIPNLQPADDIVTDKDQWCLADKGRNYLIYVKSIGDTINARLPGDAAAYRIHWIDSKTGAHSTREDSIADGPLKIEAKTNALWLERMPSD